MPENSLSVDAVYLSSEISADEPRRYSFQVIDQLAQLRRRVRLKQQMDVIFLTIKFDQFGTPLLERLPKDRIQSLKHIFCDYFAAVLSD